MLVRHNRVLDTTTTIGTDAYEVSGDSAEGYFPFADKFEVEERFEYVAEGGGNVEIGVGYLSDAVTVERETCIESTNANDFVDWPAGTKFIRATITAESLTLAQDLDTPSANEAPSTSAVDVALNGSYASGVYTFSANPQNGDTLEGVLDDFSNYFADDAESDGGIQIGATLADTIDNLVTYLNDNYFGGTMFSRNGSSQMLWQSADRGSVGNKILYYSSSTAPVTASVAADEATTNGTDGISLTPGPQGAIGPAGPTGPSGTNGASGLIDVAVALTDGATPALDASLGSLFTLTAAGNRTIAVPTNASAGKKFVIAHTASGADRTLALNTGAGGFRFGSDLTTLSATVSGKTDYIGCRWNAGASKWDVIAYVKGY